MHCYAGCRHLSKRRSHLPHVAHENSGKGKAGGILTFCIVQCSTQTLRGTQECGSFGWAVIGGIFAGPKPIIVWHCEAMPAR